jgi:hypothetical protein
MAEGTAHFDRADHLLGRDHIEDNGSSRREPNMAKARKTNEKGASTRVKAGDAFLMPLPDGRFGFCHVFYVPVKGDNPLLRGHIMVETSAWTGTEPPDLNDLRLREVHVNTHHNSGPNVWRVMVRGPAPESFKRLGTIEPNATKQQVIAVWTSWESLAREVFTQWRWDHDREALLREEQAAIEEKKVDEARLAEQERKRLDQLTLPSLLKKRRFARWKGYSPDKGIAGCRTALREAIEALIAMGPKPKKPSVAAVIRRCVEKLNALDEKHDGFIETGEREDLCREINEIVHAAGLRGCDGMADEWREW